MGVVDTAKLDPHFARLLSGLTLSETVAVDEEAVEKSLTPQLSSYMTSVPEVLPEIAPKQTLPTTGSGRTSALDVTPVGQSRRSRDAPVVLESPPLRMTSNASQSFLSNPTTSPVRPFRGTSRRTSSTADISPYLSKAPEIPSSAKHLKQIALLEAVANESARMSPMLQMRDAVVNSVAKDQAARYSQSFVSQSVPHPFSPPLASHDENLLYSSTPMGGSGFPPPPILGNTSYQSMHDDPFIVRPRTSQASHRASYAGYPNMPGSMSMTHSQLSALMNPPRASPALPMQMLAAQAQSRFPSSVSGYTPFAATADPPPNYFASYATTQHSVPVPTGSVPPLPLQVPMSAPALSPVFNAPSFPYQGPSTLLGNPLLSILNGNLNKNSNALLPGAYRGPV